VKRYGKYRRKLWNDKKKYGRKISWNGKWYRKYGRKVRWIVKRHGKHRKKVSWIVIIFRNMKERYVE
jgi:hypothetical protein